ncbi:serine/threonine-protein kinase [Rhodobacter capsulatus]|uniref:serine/threonine-protein kinase n=1 Tax=Rhodobacter capsulatus TaxID=1061 RepID=UPI0040278F7C
MSAGTQVLKPGSVVQDSYRIESLLGEGGMGATYRAINLATGHLVAVKVMSPAFAANRQAVELFRRESTHLRAVQHDAIIRYETTLQDREGRLFLVMEFVDGKPLKHYLARGRRLGSADVLGLGLRLAQGLACIHARGLVHRDIAPDNILIPDENVKKAKLIDFGLASDTIGTDKSIIGTGFAGKLDFCAPEQFGLFGNRVGAATDCYALGLVLMKVAGLAVPGEGKGLAAIEDRRDDIRIDGTRISEPLCRVLERLLVADPAGRATDLVPLFEQAVLETAHRLDKTPAAKAVPSSSTASSGAPPLPPAVEPTHGKTHARAGLLIALGLVVLLALGGAGFALMGKPGSDKSGAVALAGQALQADDPMVRINALIATGGADNLNAALGSLMKLANDPVQPLEIRREAMLAIARMYDPATHDPARSPFAAPDPAAAQRFYQKAAALTEDAAAQARVSP